MDANLLSTRSAEMSRIEVSPRMVTAWVAGTRVITLLAMPSSLSHFPEEAKTKINGGNVPATRRWLSCSAVKDPSAAARVLLYGVQVSMHRAEGPLPAEHR